MIQDITKLVAQRFGSPVETISAALLNGGIARSRARFRNVGLFFYQGRPLCVARWYENDNQALIEEKQILFALNAYGVCVPSFVDLIECQGKFVLLEEFLTGSDLNTLVHRTLRTKPEAVRAAQLVYEDLRTKTKEPSSKNAFIEELHKVYAVADYYQLAGDLEILREAGNTLCAYFDRAGDYVTSLVHGDLTLKNIILSVSENKSEGSSRRELVRCFDFEFTKRSHFAWIDWFRLWQYSPVLLEDELGQFEMPDDVKPFAADSLLWSSATLINEVIGFSIKASVFPQFSLPKLIEDSRNTISTLCEKRGQLPAAQLPKKPSPIEGDYRAVDGICVDVEDASEKGLIEALFELKEKYEATLLTLSKRNAAFSSAKRELAEAQHQLTSIEQHGKELSQANDLLRAKLFATEALLTETDRNLRQHIDVLHQEFQRTLQQKDQLLHGVSNSMAFRLGKVLTDPLKKIPAAKRVVSALKH